MNLEEDYRPFAISGIILLFAMITTIIGGVDIVGIWMDAMYPIFVLFAVASFAIAWIRWKKQSEES